MGQSVVAEINRFKTFKMDIDSRRIINMKFQKETDLDEFISIQNVLQKNKMDYRFDKNFDIQIL